MSYPEFDTADELHRIIVRAGVEGCGVVTLAVALVLRDDSCLIEMQGNITDNSTDAQ